MVDLAPFANLDERQEGELAVRRMVTHPDLMTTDFYQNAHAMVGNLLGRRRGLRRSGEPANQAAERDARGRLGTLDRLPDVPAIGTALFDRLKLRGTPPDGLADTSEPVLQWLGSTGATSVAIHFDLDVLNPTLVRSLLFANPDPSLLETRS